MKKQKSRTIYIDPTYKTYYQNHLFDESDPVLNRDSTLVPFIRIKADLEQEGFTTLTADFLLTRKASDEAEYYSFGIMKNYRKFSTLPNVRMRAFVIFEPPVVAPHLYQKLPELTQIFERVYIHNTEGDGYSIKGVNVSRLRKFYWPQPRMSVIESCGNIRRRQRRIVVINGNHKPRSANKELYSERIKAMVSLIRQDKARNVDLYGRGWERWWSRNSMWLPYWRNYRALMSIYKGPCASKCEILGHYVFALCFENMVMKGYVTEKIFDCFYAGTIPLYLGAPDIADLIPQKAYVDVRQFATWEQMYTALIRMTDQEIESMREAGRIFLQSEQYEKFYNGLIPIFRE